MPKPKSGNTIKSGDLAKKISDLSLLKKAEDVVILDLRKLTSMTDYFVICTGSSNKHIKAIADSVLDGLIELGIKPWHKEGLSSAQWVLLDFVDVIFHIFQDEMRTFYNLEQLWGDAPATYVTDKLIEKPEE